MDEVNVAETLANARKVLNAHREWLKKKSATVSPTADAGKGSTLSLYRENDKKVEQSALTMITPPLSRPPITSTPLKPHRGKVVPLDLTFRKGWEVEEEKREGSHKGKENGEEKQRTEERAGRRRKRRPRGTVVPVSLDSPEIGPVKTLSIPDVFTGSTSRMAWDKGQLSSSFSSALVSQPDAIQSEIRLRETIAQIQVDAGDSSLNGDSGEGDGEQEDQDTGEGVESETRYRRSMKQLHSSSADSIVPVRRLSPEHQRTNYSRKSNLSSESITAVQQNFKQKDANMLSPTSNATLVKPQSGVPKKTSTTTSSVVVVQPSKKKSSKVRVQPIHVVQPVKPALPVKQTSRPMSQQSSLGDITLEDAEDWIPPEELISPLRTLHTSLHDNRSDISVSEAMEVCPPTRYPMKKKSSDISLDDCESLPLKQKSGEEGVAGLKRKGRKSNVVVPLTKKSLDDVIQEELESSLLPPDSTDKEQKSDSPLLEKRGSENKTCLSPQEQDLDQSLPEGDPRLESSFGLGIELRSPSIERKRRSTAILPPLKIEYQEGQDRLTTGAGDGIVKEEEETRMKQEEKEGDKPREEDGREDDGGRVEKKQEEEGMRQSGEEQGTGDVSFEVPLLRVKSVSSLYTLEFKFQRKRKRSPPDYSLHARSAALPPACPLYGTEQPSAREVLNRSKIQTVSQARATHTPTESTCRSETDIFLGDRHSVASLRIEEESFDYYQRPDDMSTPAKKRDKEPSQLHEAARAGNLRKIQALLFEGHDVDETDGKRMTPLMYCILPDGKVQLHCVDLLMRNGANLDHQSSEGFTILHLSAYQGIISLMELLIMNGANPDMKDIDGRLPLHWGTHPISVKPIDLLLKHSISGVDVVDGSEMTLLMWSCYNCNATVTKCLLEKGADPEEKDNEGKTAMHWACSQCDINCLHLLLSPDMTYFKDHKGCTVIHTAAESGFILGIQYILKLRAEAVHDMDKQGRTPLHYAAAMNRVDICYLLLNKGADATQKDLQGNTALEYGKKTSNEYVVALFTCHTASMADFTRRERTLRNDSRQLTSRSCDLFHEYDDEILSESLQPQDYDTVSIATTVTSSRFTNDDDCIREASMGGYLGMISSDDKHNNQDPPLHYYFWISSGKLCWSRSKDKRNKTASRVTKLEEGPSNVVKSRPDYSPLDLHQFTFRVWLKDEPLDLLAYSNDSYCMWTVGIKKLIDDISEPKAVKSESENEYHPTTTNETETENFNTKAHAEPQPNTTGVVSGLKKGLELM